MLTVIDASAMVSFLAQDGEEQEALEAAFGSALVGGAAVPRWIELEVANALRRFVRDGRLAPAARDALLGELRSLPLRREGRLDVPRIAALSDLHGLSAYDAVYLWLAMESSAALLTRDAAQARAARAAGVPLALPA